MRSRDSAGSPFWRELPSTSRATFLSEPFHKRISMTGTFYLRGAQGVRVSRWVLREAAGVIPSLY